MKRRAPRPVPDILPTPVRAVLPRPPGTDLPLGTASTRSGGAAPGHDLSSGTSGAARRRLASPFRTSRAAPRRAALVGGLGLILSFGTAHAQEPRALDRAASDGVDRPIKDYSGEGDASSIELNPALLSGVRGLDLVIMGYRSVSPFTRGGGLGGFMSFNLGFGLATGIGVQALRPGFGGGYPDPFAARNPDATKISWALSGGDGKVAAFGLGVHWLRNDGLLRAPDLDVGLLFRIRNYASVGAVARFGAADLRPYGDLASELSIVGELAVRPLGTRTLELAGGVRSRFRADQPGLQVSQWDNLGALPRGRIAVRHKGLELAAEVEQVRVHTLDPSTYNFVRADKAVRGSVQLAVAWDFMKVSGGVHAGLGEGLDGFGLAARFSTARQGRVFWPRLVDVERVDISAIKGERHLLGLLQRLERAEKAGKRTILLVDARSTGLGWASLQEVRSALVRIRNAGGHVFAYLEDTKLKDYYLASAAEQVYLHPAGELATFGLSSTTFYLRGLLDKLGVQVEALHIDEYKSAHEMFSRTGPSDKDREQREALLDDTFAQVTHDIAQARGLSVAQVQGLVDDAPYGPDKAEQLGLVDAVVYRDQVVEKIGDAVGARVKFAQFDDTEPDPKTWSSAPYVAVVLIEGTIVDGESRTIPLLGTQFTGGDTIVAQLRAVRNDPACQGVVLRVNSPGGSALASDLIWREVSRTHEAWKKNPRKSPPIVVSMGDVAASGGYYVAAGTDHVFAQPTTLTGSIGVVSLHFDISGLLQKLGVATHTFKRGKNADIAGFYRPFTADERARMDASIRRVYDLFRKRVGDARGKTLEQVDELGRGHVYSGIDAKELGLVDAFGGLREAVALVRQRSGVGDRRELQLRILPVRKTILDLVLDLLGPERGDKGLRGRIQARRDAEPPLPLVLTTAFARLPLALLFLPQDQPSALMPVIHAIE
ncbi:signal peptide peptidase SppA [Nannocystis sp. ILAH1]|uniref:signal peptide peptidase SppA n=1 Tax=Nannocystis sp. ILAH1 TaxID=2996789 RepID=UPI0022700E76|nr:signal peptide peptidase SppA [Nannocystis sp. ILAH1]